MRILVQWIPKEICFALLTMLLALVFSLQGKVLLKFFQHCKCAIKGGNTTTTREPVRLHAPALNLSTSPLGKVILPHWDLLRYGPKVCLNSCRIALRQQTVILLNIRACMDTITVDKWILVGPYNISGQGLLDQGVPVQLLSEGQSRPPHLFSF